MRGNRFILSKQALIVFLVFFVAAGTFLAVPARAQPIAGSSEPLLQAVSGDGWTLVPTTSLSPSAPSARYNHAMAALPSGVLLFGGLSNHNLLNDTWLFNTATNTWGQIPVSSPPNARTAHAMAATPSGDVLLFGGADRTYFTATWLFNSATNTWIMLTGTPSNPPGRSGLAMATTPSGVLLFGGSPDTISSLNDTWLFNTTNNSWSQVFTSTIPPARTGHAMAATPSGDVLLFGGAAGSTGHPLNDTWLFNTTTNSWSQVFTSPTPPARYWPAMATTPSGVLLFGGSSSSSNFFGDTWLFNTTTNSWSQVSTSPTPPARYSHAMVSTPSGVLLFGGAIGVNSPLGDTWLYGEATSTPTHTVTYSLQPNWNMISLPVTPASTDPLVVFGGLPSPWYLFEWNPLAATYIGKELIVLRLGAGYWLKVPMAEDYPVSGLPNGEAQSGIDLGLNWNLIGVPYQGTIPWGAVRVSRYGGELVTIDQAVSSDWIQGMFFHWSGNLYDWFTTGGNFQSTFGYWVKAKVTGVRLVFMKP